MISEGSCDTEDWRNDAENSDMIKGINYILTHIQIEYSIFHQINAALVSTPGSFINIK